jgi:FdhD protein
MDPTDKPALTALILVGGQSRRMGTDKATLVYDGQPLWQRQWQLVTDLGLPAQLAGRSEQLTSIPLPAEAWLLDPPAGSDGPAGAIARALHGGQRAVLVIAVDMPGLNAAFIHEFISHWDGRRGLVYRSAQHFEPLFAIYTVAMLATLSEHLSCGQRSLQPMLSDCLDTDSLQVLSTTPKAHAALRNINRPEDLDAPSADRYTTAATIRRLYRDSTPPADQPDIVAREDPLEIRVNDHSIAVVMRTPGHDRELAAGFLVSEGVVQRHHDIIDILKCDETGLSKGNVVNVVLRSEDVDLGSLTRHVFSTSSCGLCGKTSIDSVFQHFAPVAGDWQITPTTLWTLADRARQAQQTFAKTGGLHASALFDLQGNLIVIREDVGRHNALDKVLGHCLLKGLLPCHEHVLILSGRVSFEMMQKALAAGIPLVAAISAPSSLAVEFAQASGQTLIGFLRDQSMNVYTHPQRLAES